MFIIGAIAITFLFCGLVSIIKKFIKFRVQSNAIRLAIYESKNPIQLRGYEVVAVENLVSGYTVETLV